MKKEGNEYDKIDENSKKIYNSNVNNMKKINESPILEKIEKINIEDEEKFFKRKSQTEK